MCDPVCFSKRSEEKTAKYEITETVSCMALYSNLLHIQASQSSSSSSASSSSSSSSSVHLLHMRDVSQWKQLQCGPNGRRDKTNSRPSPSREVSALRRGSIQEAQLSQRGRAMPRVVEYFGYSLKARVEGLIC